jgi:hypothetical protein
LVDLHGGNVRVESEGLGKGATFTVRLPLTAAYSEPNKEKQLPEAVLPENQPLPEVSLAIFECWWLMMRSMPATS